MPPRRAPVAIVSTMDRPFGDVVKLRWECVDLAATARRLASCGFLVFPAGAFALPSLQVTFGRSGDGADRLRLVDRDVDAPAPAATSVHANGIIDLVAVGWATVDTDRFLAGTGQVLWERAADDPHLGALAHRTVADTGTAAVLLEPNTEGLLAATLARHGEGPVALYLRAGAGGLSGLAAVVRAAGGSTSAVRDGPLGASVLLAGGPVSGPHLIALRPTADAGGDGRPAGTIRP